MNFICPNGGKVCTSNLMTSEGYQGAPIGGKRGINTAPEMPITENVTTTDNMNYTQYILPALLFLIIVVPLLMSN